MMLHFSYIRHGPLIPNSIILVGSVMYPDDHSGTVTVTLSGGEPASSFQVGVLIYTEKVKECAPITSGENSIERISG